MLTLFLFRIQRYHLPQVGQGVFDEMALFPHKKAPIKDKGVFQIVNHKKT